MASLREAHEQLFRRTPDERYDSLEALGNRCRVQQEESKDRWHPPKELVPTSDLTLCVADSGSEFRLNDWSFGQMCKLAGVSRDTVNRLSSKTASKVLQETLPQATNKPIQILTEGETVRSVHPVSYTRLWNLELLNVLREFATDFQPPPTANGGGTGLYCGEQDMFCFLIDPLGWAEIDGDAFAPGFFVWNSEVGRRALGIQTFWFQAVCANHIVWDATDIVSFTRKHTTNVHEGLHEIRQLIERLVQKRDARRDGFVAVLKKAMATKLGHDADEVAKVLSTQGIPRHLAQEALECARRQGRFTIFSLVDALTRLSQGTSFAADRLALDEKIASLLALTADKKQAPPLAKAVDEDYASPLVMAS